MLSLQIVHLMSGSISSSFSGFWNRWDKAWWIWWFIITKDLHAFTVCQVPKSSWQVSLILDYTSSMQQQKEWLSKPFHVLLDSIVSYALNHLRLPPMLRHLTCSIFPFYKKVIKVEKGFHPCNIDLFIRALL